MLIALIKINETQLNKRDDLEEAVQGGSLENIFENLLKILQIKLPAYYKISWLVAAIYRYHTKSVLFINGYYYFTFEIYWGIRGWELSTA